MLLRESFSFKIRDTLNTNKNILTSDKRRGVKNSNGFWIHCSTRECGYTWYYTGKMIFYATCPSCKRNIRIEKNKVSAVKQRSQYFHKQVGRHGNGNIAAPIVRPIT